MLTSTENVHDAQVLAQAIVNTIPEPFLVLDEQFHVLAASRSFYETFKVDPEQTRGCPPYALGDGQWDIPALRVLLETVIPEKAACSKKTARTRPSCLPSATSPRGGRSSMRKRIC